MTQMLRTKIMNIIIIVFMALSMIGSIIYCIVTPHDNLFNVATAISKNKSEVNVLIDEYVGKSNSKKTFDQSTPLPKSKLWTGLVNKPAKQEQLEQSGKELYFTKKSNVIYYAYHITLKSSDKRDVIYDVTINGLKDSGIIYSFGSWDKNGFVKNAKLVGGVIEPKKDVDLYVLFSIPTPTNQLTKPVSQNKKFSLTVTTYLDTFDK